MSFLLNFTEKFPNEEPFLVHEAFNIIAKEVFRNIILEEDQR